jgi:undecaprenyl-diphosphatase
MTNAQAIILGIVQGLTEYVPISSSAHLVLLPKIMGWQFLPKESFVFDILVQLGTLLGILIYFFSSIKEIVTSVILGIIKKQPFYNEDARLGWMVVFATIPAALLGIIFKEQVAKFFSSPIYSCYFLIFTGLILIMAEYLSHIFKDYPTRNDAFIIGFAQALALFPGISRSGATIAAGMACGLARKNAARFSFLMSIPVMVGASMIASFEFIKDKHLFDHLMIPLLLGFISAALSGYFVIKWLMAFLTSQRLTWFAAYCIVVGILGVGFLR